MSDEKAVVNYTTDSGSEVKLSPSIIRRYLVDGGGNVSDQEVMMFLMLCKQQRLDPFLREAYLIKYGSGKATLVTGKEVFTKRAERHPDFRGMTAGVVVQKSDGGALEYREGSLVLKGEKLVGGWAKVWKANREVPYQNSVTFDEYVGLKKDGTVNSQWSNKPATMIRKVALVQTLREAFPETFSGMYDADEMSHVQSDTLDDSPVDIPKDVTPEKELPKGKTAEPAQPTDDAGGLLVGNQAPTDDAKGKAEMAESVERMQDTVTDAEERDLDNIF